MSECLYIRLSSQTEQPIQWLVWSTSQQEIIASGELPNAQALASLSEKATNRHVIALASASDVLLKSLKVPAKSQRAVRMAAPYMLEEELAQDVDQLFFAYADLKPDQAGNNCHVAIIERELMVRWQQWLTLAGIQCRTMMVDVLCLPQHEQLWSALSINSTMLIRKSIWQGAAIDNSQWQILGNQWQSTEEKPSFAAYSPLPALPETIDVQRKDEELPLALLAQHYSPLVNLFQGDFAIKQTRSPALSYWLWAASFLAIAILLNVGLKTAKLWQLNTQQQAVEQQIISTYKQAFPNTRRVRVSTIKSQLKRKLSEIGDGDSQAQFLPMLAKLAHAFEQIPQLRPNSIKFDGKRKEIRLQAEADDYQSFDKFKTVLEQAKLTVTQGAQNNQGDSVTGSLSIKG